jgi:predicted naringenin-chalcone synthase
MKKSPDAQAPHISAIGLAAPDHATSQEEAVAFLLRHYGGSLNARSRRVMKKIFDHPGISQRKFALDRLECLVDEDPDQRMERFTHHAVALASRAITHALGQTSIPPDQIKALVVNTCTGYLCPGLSTYLIEKMGLPDTLQAFDLVGSGCGGAIPNLQLAASLSAAHTDGAVLSVSVEICSATFQMADDLSLIVSNALFADGAAAAVISKEPAEWRLVSSMGRIVPSQRDAVRFVYRNGQLHNQLAENLPELVKTCAVRVVTELLESAGLDHEDIRFWALHPGGDRIISAVQQGLKLTEAQLGPTRLILSRYGNMSSPTVFFVLEEIMKAESDPGDYCMMVAFGAGLSAYACLLKKTGYRRKFPCRLADFPVIGEQL